MRRREFITLLGGAVAWPVAARAQQSKRMRRIGVLMPYAANDPQVQSRNAAFLQGLQQLGWTVGPTLRSTTAGPQAMRMTPANTRPSWSRSRQT